MTDQTAEDEVPDRRQIRQEVSWDLWDYQWGPGTRRTSRLQALLDRAGRCADSDDWDSAQEIYTTVAEGAMEHYETVDDEGGTVAAVIALCSDGLIRCFLHSAGGEEGTTQEGTPGARLESRQRLLRTLYDLWWFDTAAGGLVLIPGLIETLIETAEDSEKEQFAQWIRSETRQARNLSRSWRLGSAAFLLAALFAESEADADRRLLEEYVSAGLFEDACGLLINAGRDTEALEMARAHVSAPQSVILVASALMATGAASGAVGLVEEKLEAADREGDEKKTARYLTWLARAYREQAMPDRAMHAEWRLFEHDPGYPTYRRLRSVCTSESSERVSSGAIAILEKRRDWESLVRICLAEGDGLRARLYASYGLEETDPEAAAKGYQQVAETLLGRQEPASDEQAAEYLRCARRLYDRLDRMRDWHLYLTDLCRRCGNMPSVERILASHGVA